MTAASLTVLDGLVCLARRNVLQQALGASPRLGVVLGGKMSSLDRVVPQATQLPLLNRLLLMIVLGETNLSWLKKKIGFKNLRNVYYYVEAARWARLLDENEVRPTSLGRRYVASRFDPRVMLEGVRGRALFEEVMRVTAGEVPTPAVVAGVLRRWSFRYSRSTLARRASDFCTLFGSIVDKSANPTELTLVVHTAWVDPRDLPTIEGVAMVWPVLQLLPLPVVRYGKGEDATASSATRLQVGLEDKS